MGSYFSRFCIALCGFWSYNLIKDSIKKYKHTKNKEPCYCYSCYNFYRDYKTLTYVFSLTFMPNVINHVNYYYYKN